MGLDNLDLEFERFEWSRMPRDIEKKIEKYSLYRSRYCTKDKKYSILNNMKLTR